MSLAHNFEEWCRLRGFAPKPAVYLRDGLAGLCDGSARLVRSVDRSKRATNRDEQRYVVEAFRDGELLYPFGAKPMGRQDLLRAMIDDLTGREGRGR